MPPARFMRDYWQKHPLLIRGAFPDYTPPLTPDELAGLACEDIALGRLVVRDPKRDRWQVRSGPFTEADFAALPETHWTLLVQDVDKWDAEIAKLFDAFPFLPRWRMDDVMISYAEDGGGVGAHIDQYDVFLLQGIGRRRWRISTDRSAPTDCRTDVELRLLARFTPTHDWICEPGDLLYLPPGIAHDGIAVGSCLTISVGLRAPGVAELLLDLAEHLAEPLDDTRRYADPDLEPVRDPFLIGEAAITRLETALAPLRQLDGAGLRDWFAGYITRYRAAQTATPPKRRLDPAALAAMLAGGARLHRFPWTRCAYLKARNGALLYAAGQRYPCSTRFAKLVAAEPVLDAAVLGALAERDAAVLLGLVNDGHLVVQRKRRRP